MSDPLSTTRSARESLARGLNALQADPSVPSHLVDLAQPIAQAMGALHQIERTNQLAPHADVALGHVRGALAQLQQAAAAGHPAVNAALEAVAQSLSAVHTLSNMAKGAAAPPVQAQPAPVQAQPPVQQQQPVQTAPAFAQTQVAPPNYQAPPMQAAPMVARDPFAAPAPPPQAAPVAHHAAPVAHPPAAAPVPGAPVPAPPAAGGVPVITADLGAHSATNFYKGLSGNDIIDHGGLFVSTYVPPKLGTPVRLKVSLPGGYEFEANAVVKWTREQGDDASPGFGAQFTAITNEARQLVYRYVRNREPLFHDDF